MGYLHRQYTPVNLNINFMTPNDIYFCAVPFFNASSKFDFIQETSSFDFQVSNIAKAKASLVPVIRVGVEIKNNLGVWVNDDDPQTLVIGENGHLQVNVPTQGEFKFKVEYVTQCRNCDNPLPNDNNPKNEVWDNLTEYKSYYGENVVNDQQIEVDLVYQSILGNGRVQRYCELQDELVQ